MPRKVSKRSYRKRPQKARRSRRRYYRRRYYRRSAIKKPEIHINKDTITFLGASTNPQNGEFVNITQINGTAQPNSGDVQYTLNNVGILGKKLRLKYLYIKGYLSFTDALDDNINGKLYIFRRQKNLTNGPMTWQTVLDMPFGLNTPANWTQENIRDVLYCYDWKNDLKGQIKHYVKKIYAKYDNTNNVIPFKIRIPLYDCVLTCDSSFNSTTSLFEPSSNPSTNGIYISYVSTTPNNTNVSFKLKWKLYYTDY